MKAKFLLLISLFLMTASAWAEPIDTSRIVAAATGDWNKDGRPDLVLLVGTEDEIDIHLFVQDAEHDLLKPVVVAKNKVWGNTSLEGTMGNEAAVRALPGGSISVYSHNDAIGRDRWELTLTIAYRNRDFVVAGFTYSFHDTLDEKNQGTCDLNLLTGKGKKNGKPLVAKANPVRIQDWSQQIGMKACGLEE